MTRVRILTAGLLAVLGVGRAGAVNIVLDYSYDTQGFFSNAVAKTTLERAAADLSAILTDSMGALNPVSDFVGTFSTFRWEYSLNFTHPGNNAAPTVTLTNAPIAANEYRIYAGGRALAGGTAGRGGSGGSGFSYGTVGGGGGSYFQSEINTINAQTTAFNTMIDARKTAGNDFRAWGGSITFDNDGSTVWYYDLNDNSLANNQSDFYSVALHELAHAMGFGGTLWSSLVTAGKFTGANSTLANGGVQVSTSPGADHWINGTTSKILKGGDSQEAALDPSILNGTRKLLTDLDVAGLKDIGWQINPDFSYDPADLDSDGDVDDADFGIAFAAFTGPGGAGVVPEPTSLAMLAVASVVVSRRRRA